MAFNAAARKSSDEDRHEPMNMKRMRGRGHRQGGGGGGGFRNQQNGIPLNRNHVFDSSGPEMRVRGTAQQLFDKYTQLARDAASGGDRVLGEAYYQHAEHYFRILSAINQAQGLPPPGQNQPQQNGEFQRREQPAEGAEAQGEPRAEGQPERRQDGYQQDRREQRPQQDRRFEPRQRQDFQPRDRNEPRGERPFRPAPAPVAETPIDISSALEAELQATVAEPAVADIPAIQQELPIAPEPRAIPIVADAPPPAAEEPAAAPVRRPRGRPRTKPVAAEVEKASE